MFEVHEELKKLIPPLSDDEREQLEENVLAEGIRDPLIVGTLDGKEYLVDGHNRYEIAQEYDLPFEVRGIKFDSFDDMKVWMVKNQLGRRNINSYTRIELALMVKDELSKKGKENQLKGLSGMETKESVNTQKEVAEIAGVSAGTVWKAEKVQEKADEETKEKLREGEMSINEAYRKVQQEEKREERDRKLEEQRQNPQTEEFVDIFNTDKKYKIIYADPPWKYNQSSSDTRTGFADAHYSTMDLDELREIPIKNIAEKDSVLFLWATNPLLQEALELMYSWGFDYKTEFVWHKGDNGLGYYNRVVHEHLLIGTKGKCTPDSDKRIPSVQYIEKGEHSEKPDEFRKIIEELYIGNKIELFAREIPDGWDAWGNEVVR